MSTVYRRRRTVFERSQAPGGKLLPLGKLYNEAYESAPFPHQAQRDDNRPSSITSDALIKPMLGHRQFNKP